MKIALGADHRGFKLKEFLRKKSQLAGIPIIWIDMGAYDDQRSDYPLFVNKVCADIINHKANAGILLCGSGVGMSIAANRYPGIHAALVWNEAVARMSKEDDNANVLVLPADFISQEEVCIIITAWLKARFKGGRYQERLAMIDSRTI